MGTETQGLQGKVRLGNAWVRDMPAHLAFQCAFQGWFRCGSGIVQVWSRCGSGTVQVWFWDGSGVVQVWSRNGSGPCVYAESTSLMEPSSKLLAFFIICIQLIVFLCSELGTMNPATPLSEFCPCSCPSDPPTKKGLCHLLITESDKRTSSCRQKSITYHWRQSDSTARVQSSPSSAEDRDLDSILLATPNWSPQDT